MRCLVTAGPTYEPLDRVRRLTNFSTGRLGTELAGFLSERGHSVCLLVGEQATWPGERRADQVEPFGSTADLLGRLNAHASAGGVEAVFHAAAVSDFTFGGVWERGPGGELLPLQGGKLSTRSGSLLAELIPTPKILPTLRDAFPGACLVGWKYEVDGSRDQAVARGAAQIRDCRTNACVVNGAAYGPGFGLLMPTGEVREAGDSALLFQRLDALLRAVR